MIITEEEIRSLGALIPCYTGGTFENDPPDAIIDTTKRFLHSIQQEFSQLKGLFAIIVNLPDEVTIAEVKQTMRDALEP